MDYILGILFPYFVLFYILDSIAHIKNHHLLFISHFGNRFKLKGAGLTLIGLSPLSQAINSHRIPIYFTSTGFYALRYPYRDEKLFLEMEDLNFVDFKEVNEVRTDGAEVRINDSPFMKVPSPLFAQQLADLIRDMTHSGPESRYQKMERFLAETTDRQVLRSLKEKYAKHLALLKVLCVIFSLNLFILLPLVLYTELSLSVNLPFLFSGIGLNYFIILTMAYWKHRQLYPNQFRQRGFMILSTIFSPITAIHVLHHLTRDMYHRFDSLTLAAELLKRDDFKDQMRKEFQRIHTIRVRGVDESLNQFLELKERTFKGLLNGLGIPPEEIIGAPKRQDPLAISYCPLCRIEYRSGFDTCSDCGVSLKEYH
jgi:hypothetical protein